jgi:hypothetical protein
VEILTRKLGSVLPKTAFYGNIVWAKEGLQLDLLNLSAKIAMGKDALALKTAFSLIVPCGPTA